MRRKTILTTAAILAVGATPASAMYGDMEPPPSSMAASAAQDLRSSDAVDAAEHRGLYEQSAQGRPESYALQRDYGSPDGVDAARDLPPVRIPAPVVASAEPASGFAWSDAGLGAAGMLALLSITAGSALLLTGRKHRNPARAATH